MSCIPPSTVQCDHKSLTNGEGGLTMKVDDPLPIPQTVEQTPVDNFLSELDVEANIDDKIRSVLDDIDFTVPVSQQSQSTRARAESDSSGNDSEYEGYSMGYMPLPQDPEGELDVGGVCDSDDESDTLKDIVYKDKERICLETTENSATSLQQTLPNAVSQLKEGMEDNIGGTLLVIELGAGITFVLLFR